MPVPERLPKQKQRWAHQPEAQVEEGQNLQIQDEGENPKIQAVEEGAHLQIQAVDQHKYVNRALARHVVGVIGKQRDKAKRQARHWQTIAQKQKAKICKLEAENKTEEQEEGIAAGPRVPNVPLPKPTEKPLAMRRFYIRRSDVIRLGATRGCPGCILVVDVRQPQAHAESCRKRITRLMAEDQDLKSRVSEAAATDR